MDTRLRIVRQARGWSQARLVVELERASRRRGLPPPNRASLKTQVSRWENGHVNPHDSYAELLAEIYETTPADLGLGSGQPLPLWPGTERPSDELLVAMEHVFAEYARVDNAVGSAHLLGVAGQHVALLEHAAVEARGELQSRALSMCSRFAELAGWLSQDAGDLLEAERWTDRALDFVEAFDDPSARAYLLMRKSAIAADRQDRARSVALATAASLKPEGLAPELCALVFRQLAIGQALVGGAFESQRAADLALEAVDSIGEGRNEWAYCTQPFILMEAGVAAMRLRQYDLAADRLAKAAAAWPNGFPRDQGLCLARLALAEAALGNVDQACSVASTAMDIVVVASSARSRATFQSLVRRLTPHKRSTVVSVFLDHYSQKLG